MRRLTLEEMNQAVGKLYTTGLKRGLRVPWAGLNPLYSVAPAQHTLVTGYPGSGKSEWLDDLIVGLLKANPSARCAYYSPENKPYELHIAKLLEKHNGSPFSEGPTARMTPQEAAESFTWLTKRIDFIDEGDGSQSIFDVLSDRFPVSDLFWHTQESSGTERPYFLVIDPWNFLVKQATNGQTEADYLSEALGRVDSFCHMTNAHVFIVAHPKLVAKTKDGIQPVPTFFDVAGGAHWGNKLDNIITVHRTDKTDPRSSVQIHVQKVRFKHIGEVGMCELGYDRVNGRYRDWVQAVPEHRYGAGVF
jgi:hypothetical protein